MKRNGIEYPQPENQGKRKEQYEAAAKCIIISLVLLMALALGALLWNNRNIFFN